MMNTEERIIQIPENTLDQIADVLRSIKALCSDLFRHELVNDNHRAILSDNSLPGYSAGEKAMLFLYEHYSGIWNTVSAIQTMCDLSATILEGVIDPEADKANEDQKQS